MARREILSRDPITGIETIFHDRPDTDGFTLETRQDISSIIEANKKAQNEGDGYTPSRDMKHVATVPFIVLQIWAQEAGVEMSDPAFSEIIKRKLNDSDLKYFRTGMGDV